MKIKYYVAILIIFFVSMLLFGCDPTSIGSTDYGTSQVSGYVRDYVTNDPIMDAVVVSSPGTDTLKTDKNGYFIIQSYTLSADPQDVDLIAKKIGYQDCTVSVKLTSDGKESVTFPLVRN